MKHFNSYLRGSGLDRRSPIDLLQQLWTRNAPDYLREISTIRQYHDNCLVLQIHSPIWISRIRQQQASLIRQLRQCREFADLDQIKLEVVPRQIKPSARRQKRRSRPLSAQARSSLRTAANQVGDPGLRDALVRLANIGQE